MTDKQTDNPHETRVETEILDRMALGSPEHRICDEDQMFLNDDVADDVEAGWEKENDRFLGDLLDEAMDEYFAERSPYRGMNREQREQYDREFEESHRAGTTSLGDLFREALLKKADASDR